MSRGKSSALSAPRHAPAWQSTSQLGLQGDGAAAASASSKKHWKPHTAISIPHQKYNVAPRLYTSHGTPGLATGIPSTPQSRGAFAPLRRGCCRAGMDPLKHRVSHHRDALQQCRMSFCRAPGGFTPPQPWYWCGLLLCCEMGSRNTRPVLPRKRQSGSGIGKTLQWQTLPFQKH